MKYYQVVRKYFDVGLVQANSFNVEADAKPDNSLLETPSCSICVDYFENPVEAEDFRQAALNANAE